MDFLRGTTIQGAGHIGWNGGIGTGNSFANQGTINANQSASAFPAYRQSPKQEFTGTGAATSASDSFGPRHGRWHVRYQPSMIPEHLSAHLSPGLCAPLCVVKLNVSVGWCSFVRGPFCCTF